MFDWFRRCSTAAFYIGPTALGRVKPKAFAFALLRNFYYFLFAPCLPAWSITLMQENVAPYLKNITKPNTCTLCLITICPNASVVGRVWSLQAPLCRSYKPSLGGGHCGQPSSIQLFSISIIQWRTLSWKLLSQRLFARNRFWLAM